MSLDMWTWLFVEGYGQCLLTGGLWSVLSVDRRVMVSIGRRMRHVSVDRLSLTPYQWTPPTRTSQ